MPANGYSTARTTDRSSAVVTAGMLLLAVLGVATVFYEPIAAVIGPGPGPAPGPGSSASPSPSASESTVGDEPLPAARAR